MTHPIDTPRGSTPALGKAPPPIEHVPAGGCMGTNPPKRVHATCLTCPRFMVGGVQIQPTYVVRGPRLECDDFVHGDVTVLALSEPRQSAKCGGVAVASYGGGVGHPPKERDVDAGVSHALHVEYVVRMPTREERNEYLARYAHWAGQPAADALRAAVRQAWTNSKKPRAPEAVGPAARSAWLDGR